MGAVSVAQAAERLGVSVPRIHQCIADGSLSAERIGSQWAVDERSLLRIEERSKAGRPYSVRSAWAVIAASEGDRDRVGVSGPAVPARARMQLKRLLEPAAEPVAEREGRPVAGVRRVGQHHVPAGPAGRAGHGRGELRVERVGQVVQHQTQHPVVGLDQTPTEA